MILSAQTIRDRVEATKLKRRGFEQGQLSQRYDSPEFALMIEPFFAWKELHEGMSYGLTAAGYDIRIGSFMIDEESHMLEPSGFILTSSLERLEIPHDLIAIVHDKSSMARRGIALQNTVLEPGWQGYITLEISNHGFSKVRLTKGMPIAQIIFHQLDKPTELPYQGKYQNQPARPVSAIKEEN